MGRTGLRPCFRKNLVKTVWADDFHQEREGMWGCWVGGYHRDLGKRTSGLRNKS